MKKKSNHKAKGQAFVEMMIILPLLAFFVLWTHRAFSLLFESNFYNKYVRTEVFRQVNNKASLQYYMAAGRNPEEVPKLSSRRKARKSIAARIRSKKKKEVKRNLLAGKYEKKETKYSVYHHICRLPQNCSYPRPKR